MVPRKKVTVAISVVLMLVAIALLFPADAVTAPASSARSPRDATCTRAVATLAESSVLAVERSDATPPPTQLPAAPTFPTMIFPVKDLMFGGGKFLPPRIRMTPGVSRHDTQRPGSDRGDPIAYGNLPDLVANLKQATDPSYWRRGGAEIRSEDSGYLLVKASPEMQQQVERVLADMRALVSNRASGSPR